MLNLDTPVLRTYEAARLQTLSEAISYCLPEATHDTKFTLALMRQAIDKEMERRERAAERTTR
jgi:hypothetical protein